MKKTMVFIIFLGMLLSTMSSGVIAIGSINSRLKNDSTSINPLTSPQSESNGDIEIIYPEPGYLYLYRLQPIQMPIATSLNLGVSVVVDRTLQIDTAKNTYHHAKFVAQRMFTGMEVIRWDYQYIDGLSMDMSLSTGLYFVTVYAYDENNQQIGSDSVKVFYLKAGRDDFGVWINTRFDNGLEISKSLDIGIPEFHAMLDTGETKDFKVSMQSQDDTTVQLRFTRTKILEMQENVIETRFNVATECDTTRDYETSVEVRFPFITLEGGQPSENNNPYFSARVGYFSSGSSGVHPNKVNTSFYFGKDSLLDPAVFRMMLKPTSIEAGSGLTFFNSYQTVDENGFEVFQRTFSVAFTPATELTITTIPREAKIRYDFGESAGTKTQIAFSAEGGLLDDIIQRFTINPLPSFMAFDLTILGNKEFLYESDQTYDVSYQLDSEQNGNLVSFEVFEIPRRIHATWCLDLGELGDLKMDSFAELNMSDDVSHIALYFHGNKDPFVKFENIPRNIRIESAVDVLGGTGNVLIERGLVETRDIIFTLDFDEVQLIKSFSLKNNFILLSWDINIIQGTGKIDIQRDSDSTVAMSTVLTYGEWTFSNSFTLKNTHVQLQWDVNREDRRGNIRFSRSASSGYSSVSTSIAKNNWAIVNTLELKHSLIEMYWDLPSSESTHGEIGFNTSGDSFLENSLVVQDDEMELLNLSFGIKTDDHLELSWENNEGVISDFQWEGKIIQLTDLNVAVHLPGDLMTLSADWKVTEQGAIEVELNKQVEIQFVDIQTPRTAVEGQVKFNANAPLRINWKWGELGYFTVNTYGQNLGEDFGLKFFYDPTAQSNYRYGFNISAPEFLNAYVNISWYKGAGQTFPTIWVIGNPFPTNWIQWNKWLLWDYEWWEVT